MKPPAAKAWLKPELLAHVRSPAPLREALAADGNAGGSPRASRAWGSRCQALILNNDIVSSFASYPFVRPSAALILWSRPAGPSWPPRRGGQGWPLAMSFTTYILSRPFLHGPEHGCTLGASRSTSRGVRPAASERQDDLRPAAQGWRPRSRATSLYSVNLRAGDRNLDAVMRIGGEASSDASSFS